MSTLSINNLHVSIDSKPILKGISLQIKPGEVHALMGPNGSGKSTLAQTIMGNDNYQADKGEILLEKKNILKLKPEERAKLGIFMSWQHPVAIPGVSVIHFLKAAYKNLYSNEHQMTALVFFNYLKSLAKILLLNEELIKRPINEGLSGGEKKKMEALQILVLKPKFIILDEIDSGTDVDALKTLAKAINELLNTKYIIKPGILLITHYNRICKYLKPDFVHIIKQGKIVKSGNIQLIEDIEKMGYKQY